MRTIILASAGGLLLTVVSDAAFSQVANKAYSGIAVLTIQSSKCPGGTSDFILDVPVDIAVTSGGATVLKALATNITPPASGGPTLSSGGDYIFYLLKTGTLYFYQFTSGPQRNAAVTTGTIAFEPGTDPQSGLPNLGFQLNTTAGCQNGSTVPFTVDGGAVAFPNVP